MKDQIHTMRSYFASAGHDPIDPVIFAGGMLRTTKAGVERQLAGVGFVPRDALETLAVDLGDPELPADHPITAYVNASEWKAKCECGGVEFVDLEKPLFMCCVCWNKADGHAWRPVEIPNAHSRAMIERLLLRRPNVFTRNWRPDETIVQLAAENVVNGVMVPGDEIHVGDAEITVEETA